MLHRRATASAHNSTFYDRSWEHIYVCSKTRDSLVERNPRWIVSWWKVNIQSSELFDNLGSIQLASNFIWSKVEDKLSNLYIYKLMLLQSLSLDQIYQSLRIWIDYGRWLEWRCWRNKTIIQNLVIMKVCKAIYLQILIKLKQNTNKIYKIFQ